MLFYKRWKKIPKFFILLLCLLPSLVLADINHVTDLRIQPHSKYIWRIVIETTQAPRYQQSILNNPARLVMDIQQTNWRSSFKSSYLRHTPILEIRRSQKGSALHLVFDLKNRFQINTFVIPARGSYPNRLVIDLKSTTVYKPQTSVLTQTPLITSTPKITESADIGGENRSPYVIIVIDPGHGGKDSGAVGSYNTKEKNVVLQISRDLQDKINQQPGFKAYLTRTGDYYLTLRQRLAIARRYKPDMFIAIHADAYRNRNARGASVFALSQRGATSEAARWLATRENESELMGGVDLSDKNDLLKSVLINLSQTASVRASLQIGQQIMRALGNFVHLHRRKVEQAAFVVLKSPDIPSLLVETGFISNPSEEMKLNNPKYQQQLSTAITQGIQSYFLYSPPRSTWLAQRKK